MSVLLIVRNYLLSLSRKKKNFLQILNDFFCYLVPYFIASALLYLFRDLPTFTASAPIFFVIFEMGFYKIAALNLFIISIIAILNGYKTVFRHSNENLLNIFSNPRTISTFIYFLILSLITANYNPIQEAVIFSLGVSSLIFISLIVTRSFAYIFIKGISSNTKLPIIIYGAGQAGRETAAYLEQNDKYKILGYIDDDKNLKGLILKGHKVFGGINKLKKYKKNYPNLLIVLSIIDITPSSRNEIISSIEKFEISVKTIPDGYGSLHSKMSIQDLDLSDLIGRELIKPSKSLLQKTISGKNILVTGAGGSIGSEISCQILRENPSKLVLVDFSEFNLYKLKEKLMKEINFNDTDIKFLILDISNSDFKEVIISEEIQIIYHSAAYKHVPLLESKENHKAAIKNNFFNTFSLCKLCSENKVESLILISSDKAVNPTNLMGATKRLSELSLQAFNKKKENKTIFSMVRFGNVLNSSGSVVPLFWQQIYEGGPVTVTHSNINRFFMTIEEASNLVIQAGSMAKGGEVFLLDMGKPIRIKNLAEKMIKLSGNSVSYKDNEEGIKIIYSGLRPGEKLYEELLLSKKNFSTEHPRIKKGVEKDYPLDEMVSLKEKLENLLSQNKFKESKMLVAQFVEGYDISKDASDNIKSLSIIKS
tara:strand:- start:5085 stop:7037 length:1953 start_codon:yes stop_codon:yes gene_type:complete